MALYHVDQVAVVRGFARFAGGFVVEVGVVGGGRGGTSEDRLLTVVVGRWSRSGGLLVGGGGGRFHSDRTLSPGADLGV